MKKSKIKIIFEVEQVEETNKQPWTREQIIEIFRNAGFKVTESDGAIVVGLNRFVAMAEVQSVVWNDARSSLLEFARYGREIEVTVIDA